MKIAKTAAAVATTVAMMAVPAAQAAQPDHAQANGKRCQGVSKKHVKGQKGTPFSQCVKANKKAKKVKPAPAPTEPAPTEPAPTEPAPTEPAPTEPAPTA